MYTSVFHANLLAFPDDRSRNRRAAWEDRGDTPRRRGACGPARDGRGGREGDRVRRPSRRRSWNRHRQVARLSRAGGHLRQARRRCDGDQGTSGSAREQGSSPRRARSRPPGQMGGPERAVELPLPAAALRARPPWRAAATRGAGLRPRRSRAAGERAARPAGRGRGRPADGWFGASDRRSAGGRRGASPRDLGRLDLEWGPGGARLRAVAGGVVERQCLRRRMPRRPALPVW